MSQIFVKTRFFPRFIEKWEMSTRMNNVMDVINAERIEDVQAALQEPGDARLRIRGGGSKTALSAPRPGEQLLDLSRLSGILEYEPGEYTFTALAGTPIREVEATLAEHGQYLPFDPPLAGAGATLGGTVAAGLSGSGRQRYGGVRDFLIGARFVDGQGRLVRGGGKVVKNAAGFDLPKLMVGSLGRLGALVDLSFKVFPRPAAYASVKTPFASLDEAVDAMVRLSAAPLDVEALDLTPGEEGFILWARLGGVAEVLDERAERLRGFLNGGDILTGEEERAHWRTAGDFAWLPAGASLVKVALTPAQVPALEKRLPGPADSPRRYSVGGALAWLAWQAPLAELDAILTDLNLPGLLILGDSQPALIGRRPDAAFLDRIKRVLDPEGRLLEF
jgi:glycolate oxidase FAD binding subunit